MNLNIGALNGRRGGLFAARLPAGDVWDLRAHRQRKGARLVGSEADDEHILRMGGEVFAVISDAV